MSVVSFNLPSSPALCLSPSGLYLSPSALYPAIMTALLRLVRYWDDWMREPAQRLERACIRPEVSRTRTFGKKGVSK